MNVFKSDTKESLGHFENIEEVNMISESKIDYARDKYGKVVSRFVHDPTYTITFNSDEPFDTEEFYRVLGIDISNMPDAYDVQFVKFVQAHRHKKRRINKKWLKRYGYKQMIVECKGWKIKHDTYGHVEFVK